MSEAMSEDDPDLAPRDWSQGPLQTAHRAELWGVIIALQSYWPCHLGIDNPNVARSRLPDNDRLEKPLPLVKDGDLVAVDQYKIRTRGRDTVRVTKVKGNATDADVEQGRVLLEDRLGNAEADAAADLGRRHESELRVDAKSIWLKVRNHWYPLMLQLHRFTIAVAKVAANYDGTGGSASDPLILDQGGEKKMCRTDISVNLVLASLPGPLGFLSGPWIQVHGSGITGADVAAWPCSVGILCKFSTFLSTLFALTCGYY